MKRKLIASILGAAASSAMVASSYGQGSVIFANYSASDTGSPSAPCTFGAGSGGLTGTAVGNNVGGGFTAELLYQFAGMSGGIAGPVAGFDLAENSLLNGAATASFYPSSAGGLFLYQDPTTSPPGGGAAYIPGYASGAVTFEVYVFGTVSAVNYAGTSAPFTINSIATGNSPAGDLFNPNGQGVLPAGAFLQPMTVAPVPEPTTLVLAGLGVASLLALRRRK